LFLFPDDNINTPKFFWWQRKSLALQKIVSWLVFGCHYDRRQPLAKNLLIAKEI